MIIGYTFLDPLVVIVFVGLSAYLLSHRAVRLIGWLPALLSINFFIQFITVLTVGKIVSLLLTGRMLLRARHFRVGAGFLPILAIMACCFLPATVLGYFTGGELIRLLLRSLHYLGLLAVFVFAYEMGRRDSAYDILIKGAAILGVLLAAYGLYQLLATYAGLPVRLIVRGTGTANSAFEGGFLRINSFADEPKRLGFILMVGALACLEWARLKSSPSRKLKAAGAFVLGMSFMTFSGSYFFAVATFVLIIAAGLMFRAQAAKYIFSAALISSILYFVLPESKLSEALHEGIDRRFTEVETGLNGKVVYRQEFFAQDYFLNNPEVALIGVGLGQYYKVLNETYGEGVGIGTDGQTLLPMNSAFFETLFDLGAVFVLLIYSSLCILVFRLLLAGERFLSLSVLFLIIQSMTINTLPHIALFAGVGYARLTSLRSFNDRRAQYYNHSLARPIHLAHDKARSIQQQWH